MAQKPVHVDLVLPQLQAEPGPDVDVSSMAELLSYLPNDPKQPFEVFFLVACACRNTGQSFAVFRDWASRYSGYDEAKAHRIFASIIPRRGGYTLSSVQRLVRRCPTS